MGELTSEGAGGRLVGFFSICAAGAGAWLGACCVDWAASVDEATHNDRKLDTSHRYDECMGTSYCVGRRLTKLGRREGVS